jgi:hypothetical protein
MTPVDRQEAVTLIRLVCIIIGSYFIGSAFHNVSLGLGICLLIVGMDNK